MKERKKERSNVACASINAGAQKGSFELPSWVSRGYICKAGISLLAYCEIVRLSFQREETASLTMIQSSLPLELGATYDGLHVNGRLLIFWK